MHELRVLRNLRLLVSFCLVFNADEHGRDFFDLPDPRISCRHVDVAGKRQVSVGCLTDDMSKINEEKRESISGGEFAFPKERKEPIHDAAHVRNAIARFNQVEGVTDKEKDEAWERIKHAAAKFSVDMKETSWR
jgi:hypothetical protein